MRRTNEVKKYKAGVKIEYWEDLEDEHDEPSGQGWRRDLIIGVVAAVIGAAIWEGGTMLWPLVFH